MKNSICPKAPIPKIRTIDERENYGQFPPFLDISPRTGHQIVYTNPRAGYDGDGEYADKFLLLGRTYTVKQFNVGQSYSTVEFEEFPGHQFNTVLFMDIPSERL